MPINYGDYPKDWHSIRLRILARAGEVRTSPDYSAIIITEARCEECGAVNHRPHPRTGSLVILTIAHLDHDAYNHDVTDERLKALCQSCHLSYDLAHHVYKRKYGSGVGQLRLEIG